MNKEIRNKKILFNKDKAEHSAYTLGHYINVARDGTTPYRVCLNMAFAIEIFDVLKVSGGNPDLKLSDIKTIADAIKGIEEDDEEKM